MKLHEMSIIPGSKKKRNRVGRGIGSGNGKTAGKGMKGQNSRSGGGVGKAAAVYVRGLKAARCLCIVCFRNAVSKMFGARNMRKLT